MADGHVKVTQQLCRNTWLGFEHTHTHTHALIANRAFPPEQVDKRDHLQSGGINSTPAHTHHTSMISDVDSGKEKKKKTKKFFLMLWLRTQRDKC